MSEHGFCPTCRMNCFVLNGRSRCCDALATSPREVETHPIQTVDRKGGQLNRAVTMAAYEVYSHVYAPQPAIVTGSCRGGFGTLELIAFLYARSFPKEQWRQRVDEAMAGAKHVG